MIRIGLLPLRLSDAGALLWLGISHLISDPRPSRVALGILLPRSGFASHNCEQGDPAGRATSRRAARGEQATPGEPLELLRESRVLRPGTGHDPAVAMGAYAMALFVLGFGEVLGDLTDARRDEEGLLLDEERLPKRVRINLRIVRR